ncbi:tRNA (guanosine(18)-2'-o)-methyltransferase [Phtheirospermum japonicum]|uniref:tRNA (Guanosine(18)-2'-o)-methyltransferase n=1 Tax=Phtheirospermum japonicum TaxID=374723 RepID=A0A830BYA5_9LAMI|nr:tRNA (guanosine(18)-2'-o)-methyltransferase [Phtheirospermum japonicum]
MCACKTLIRTSLPCLELHSFASLFSTSSGLRIKSQKPFSISRSFCSAKAVIPLEISDSTENNTAAPHNVTLETPQDSNKHTVRELLSTDKDDISRLMKMERRFSKGNEFEDDKNEQQRLFPYLDKYKAGDAYLCSGEVLEAIDPYLMDVRKERFRNAVNNRSYSVCLVVEGLTDFGNISAAFRSADALGIQSVHVVSCGNSRRYKDNRHVSMGAEKWLDIELWNSVSECFENLKARGYRIATAHLGTDAVSVYDVDWSCPTAIVVGNEHRGISEEALELSDVHCSIPMRGMVDSFNVSVAAGLLMHQAVCDRTLRMGCHGDLTQADRQILLAEFYLRHNENAIRIANEFSKRKLVRPESKL